MYHAVKTERLILREFRKEDCNQELSFLTDSNVCLFMTLNALKLDEVENYIKKIINFQYENPRRFLKFMVTIKKSNQAIGECGLLMPNVGNEIGELIFRYSKDYWGHGYATEAALEMIKYGFSVLKLHRIEAICDVRNIASSGVLEKIGMKKEGCLREHKIVKGERRSSYVYSILINEFTE